AAAFDAPPLDLLQVLNRYQQQDQRNRQESQSTEERHSCAEDDLSRSLIATVGMFHLGDLCHINSAYVDDRQVAISDDQIAAAISGVIAGGEVFDHTNLDLWRTSDHRLDDVVPLDVGVFFDLVRYLQREQRQPDALVVGC